MQLPRGALLSIPCKIPVLPLMVGCTGTQTSKDWSAGHWHQRDIIYCQLLVPSQNKTSPVFSQKDKTRLVFSQKEDKTLNL